MSGIQSIQTRISQLDSLIRSVDPNWQGGLDGTVLGRSVATPIDLTNTDGTSAFSSVFQAVSKAPSVSQPVAESAAGTSVAARPAAGAASFLSPLPSGTVTLKFGPTDFSLEPPLTYKGVQYAHFHAGLDLAAPLGTPVVAAAAGTVVAAGRATDGAVIVRIRHDDGSETLYGHLQTDLSVSTGQRVAAGQTIGKVGLTGNTTGPHLHFALFAKDGTPLDPQTSIAAGQLPGATTLSSPASVADPSAVAARSTADVLARFDAVASRIPYAAQIRKAALDNGIDPLLLTSLVEAESGFQPRAVSRVGAMGLTQLMPATAKSLGVTDPYDPAQNLQGGAKYLARQIKRFGRVDLALAAYQAGPTIVGQLGAVPDYPSTKAYIAHIFATWKSYQEPKA